MKKYVIGYVLLVYLYFSKITIKYNHKLLVDTSPLVNSGAYAAFLFIVGFLLLYFTTYKE